MAERSEERVRAAVSAPERREAERTVPGQSAPEGGSPEQHVPGRDAAGMIVEGVVEHGRRLHQWLAEDFGNSIHELEMLSDGVAQAHKALFPRLSKLRTDVALLLDQARDLTSILGTLNRDYGARI